jgi:hypothetical protein
VQGGRSSWHQPPPGTGREICVLRPCDSGRAPRRQ